MKSTNHIMSKFFTGVLLLASLSITSQAQFQRTPTPNDNLIPAEVLPGNKVIFRIYAPEAKTVMLSGDIGYYPDIKFTKDEQGIWSATFPAVPGVYRYGFIVDGVAVNDPKSPIVKERQAILEVSTDGNMFWDMKDVPHGDVRTVWYPSSTTKTTRRIHIYTPPGYDLSTEKLPVLYLIHGGGDNDVAWPTIGKANFILDNLLAEGKIKRMVVVMPNGAIPTETFSPDLINDLIPYVEKNYRVLTDKNNRAIMGLSQGGLHTLNTAIPNSDKFGYIFSLSSGWLKIRPEQVQYGEELLKKHGKEVNKNVKLFMLAVGGQEDGAWINCKGMMELFDKYGVKYKYSEKPGGHTWYTWRENLYDFAPMLFK